MVGLLDGLAHLGKLADHLGLEAAGGHGEHVLDHEDLAVGAGARADADGEGRGELLCDVGAQVGGHALEDDGKGAGLLEREGVGDELLGCLGALALDLEAAEGVDGLRRQADVAHDGDAGLHHGLDLGADLDAALELDGLATALLHEAAGVADGRGHVLLVGEEGHVADDEGVARRAGDAAGVMDHVVHGHGNGGVIAHHGHAEGVSDQDHVNPGLLDERGHGVVVGGHHGDLAALVHLLLEGEHGVLSHLLLVPFTRVRRRPPIPGEPTGANAAVVA